MRKYLVAGIFSILISGIVYSCKNAQEIDYSKYLSNGKDLYITHCQNCHGEKGEGLGELVPPLTDTVFLKTNKANLACLIKNGSNKGVTINGKHYEGKMPAFPQLVSIDVAQVIVYMTNSFGNKQGMYTYEQVANDLTNCP
ncbi:MAG: cytochrome c [Bacteroidota bacterium]